MLKCIIVEDEFPAREELKYFISNHEGIELEKEFDNPVDALKFIQNNQIDIVFLDINMPEIDGISLGKIISKLNSNLKIIFITAYREYAAEAFEIKAFDYLLKPYSEQRIKEVLTNLTTLKSNELIKENNKINKITVSLGEKMIVLSIDEICYIEIVEKESIIYTETTHYSSKLKLSKWEEILPKNKFYRTHRSYIVNLDKIREIEPWFNGTYILKIENTKAKIPVSRNNIKEFKELLSIK